MFPSFIPYRKNLFPPSPLPTPLPLLYNLPLTTFNYHFSGGVLFFTR